MITLCGMSLSNYYNKVKLVLLEKGVPFTEETVATHSKDEGVLAASPLGKIPFIRTEGGALCESQVINDYLEARFPQPALLPADPFEAAKVRELCAYMELYVELVGRELYGQAYFGGSTSDATKERVRKQLARSLPGLKRMLKLAPYAAGDRFTLADAAAFACLPTVAQATKAVLGEDMVAAAGIDWKAYLKTLGERASVQRLNADRKRDLEAMAKKA
ncbi:MAG TPA: glutathione S-transferase [Rubrivivax sp.]|nr:glutathione S-transferase family protein [Pseudomonadota bacterium]MCW5639975.1 glutathione S-transferase family protein [Rubrivivax sp.]HOW47064.1 glutathione S-transferase [Rubrivivax sp.]HRY88476.1 glutathione S-transferase [Rubrivivax sp.]HRZ59549.1 glutathione S-transferase [Rubrivivax sp.]